MWIIWLSVWCNEDIAPRINLCEQEALRECKSLPRTEEREIVLLDVKQTNQRFPVSFTTVYENPFTTRIFANTQGCGNRK